jgi:AcrR family transcriptional regulator
MVMNKAGVRGRRPGRSDTRDQILSSARSRFLTVGYEAATMRSIAADAGVDVALISYFYGSKRGLFAAAMALPVNPVDVLSAVLEGDLDTLPERILAALLQTWDDPDTGEPLRVLARAAIADADLGRLVADAIGTEVIGRVAARIGGRGATGRATAFVTQTAGLIMSRYLIRIEPLASMPAERAVRLLAPTLRVTLGIAQPRGSTLR